MPGWHTATKKWVAQKRLVVLGVAQEQHPDRCLLFARWKRMDMPIVYDPINALGCKGVPIAVAIDEHGVVRTAGAGQDAGAEFPVQDIQAHRRGAPCRGAFQRIAGRTEAHRRQD